MASSFDLADKVLGGTLAERLRRMRAEGLTYDQMAEELRPAIGVSRETLRRWVVQLAVDAAEVA